MLQLIFLILPYNPIVNLAYALKHPQKCMNTITIMPFKLFVGFHTRGQYRNYI